MNLKIVWIDDETQELRFGKQTLEMKGHQVKSIETTHDFLTWLDGATTKDVDIFFLDLMMKIDEIDMNRLTSQSGVDLDKITDTGVYLYQEIRKKFSDKPIVVLTIVRKIPDVMENDQHLEFVLKSSTILPILDIGVKLLERR